MAKLLTPPLPQSHQQLTQWGGLSHSARTLACLQTAAQYKAPTLIITPDIHAAEQLQRELKFFNATSMPVYHFPDREILPYDMFSPHQDLVSERLRILAALPMIDNGIIVAALPTLLQRLPPHSHLLANSLQLEQQQTLSIDLFRQQLTLCGYRHVTQVMEHGEFLIRGAIIDIFPMGSPLPLRIELFDDSIDSLRTFDPDTQRTIEKIDEIKLLPAHEYSLTEQAISQFRQSWRAQFSGNPMESPIYEAISEGQPIAGVESYIPLFFEGTATFFDYMPNNTLVIKYAEVNDAAELYWREINHRYEQLCYDITRPLLAPERLFVPTEDFSGHLKAQQQIQLHGSDSSAKLHHDFKTTPLPDVAIHSKSSNPFQSIQQFLQTFDGNVLFCAESTGRREVILQQLQQVDIKPAPCQNWQDFLKDSEEHDLQLTVANLDHGFISDDDQFAIITETDCYGDYVAQRRKRAQHEQDPNAIIKHLTELTVGNLVVHIDHGIGRYLGLQTIASGGIDAEYLALEYANKDKIFVPVTSLHCISRYSGCDPGTVKLHRLGSAQWEKAKRKAAQQIHDVAAELLALYAKREATPGLAFTLNQDDYRRFRAAFPFEETPDQETAIDAVVSDMRKPQSMDRLICGDVGFGKTEIAMQAAFVAVNGNYQVAILVPTTLLAQQHYQSFSDRFADWPVNVGVVSRLQSAKQQKQTLEQLASGKLDIIIGTHKLLQDSVKFDQLGLIIVDEEHRFGVRQKEKIKALRAEVDILTLTATPIPRTLNMALSGSRDLSIIATPPARRLAIKTFLHRSQPAIIEEAIQRETLRGGQLYFLHNEVATIEATKEKLLSIMPNARIGIAHGQMPESQLEHVMADFYHQKFNILLCTTIIESGIDVPTANTIIINKADRFGLAQLHQIRGRVGRSHHQAYAYLLVDEPSAITRDAEKRLDALLSLEELGAGFNLATHDLEIRGAGELLGEEQSGHMQAIGFSLYMQMLELAVDALKQGKPFDFETPQPLTTDIELGISALLPENYVYDVNTRLTLYKRISGCASTAAIDDIHSELIDRFGLLPKPAQHLLDIQSLKIKAKTMDIKKIEARQKFGYITFLPSPNIDSDHLIKMIQLHPKRYQLHSNDCVRFCLDDDLAQRITNVASVIDEISGK